MEKTNMVFLAMFLSAVMLNIELGSTINPDEKVFQAANTEIPAIWFGPASATTADHDSADSAIRRMIETEKIYVKVGAVMNTEHWLGKIGLSCVKLALSDFYNAHKGFTTRIVLHPRNSTDFDVVSSAFAVSELIERVKVVAILGPETSPEAQFSIRLGNKAHVPIISYSATSPFLSYIGSKYFIRATQNDSTQAHAISALIEAHRWRQIVPIYVDNEFGEGLIPYLADELQKINTRIPYRSVINSSANNEQIELELVKLKAKEVRVFVVHMDERLGAKIFSLAEKQGMMKKGYAWIVTNGISDSLNVLTADDLLSMEGVVGVKSYVNLKSKKISDFILRWRKEFIKENPNSSEIQINMFGFWAYDAASMLARAIEEVRFSNFSHVDNDNSLLNSSLSTSMPTLGLSMVGEQLVRAILSTTFQGLTGKFELVNGQLQTSIFKFINVVGSGEKDIGFWTRRNGLTKNLSSKRNISSTYSNSRGDLKVIIWPGDTTSPPKGWVIPTDGKVLRIGVPVKVGFTEFVRVTYDLNSNRSHVTGFCISVFDEVRKQLPYDLSVEYVPFANPDGTSRGTYNDLIDQVANKTYDAVVGDTTIVYHRAEKVDFTLPYMASGVVMVVPAVQHGDGYRYLDFLRPLSFKLWVTTLVFFLLIALVIGVVEFDENEEFKAQVESTRDRVGLSLFYSFSTMVFAHSIMLKSNLTRILMIFWVFTVLILTQSYSANLASILTIERLIPKYKDSNELLKKGMPVGCKTTSFVYDLLLKMNFKKSQLIPYNTAEELADLLNKGSERGGVAAAFDEIPYIDIFLSNNSNCGRYMTIKLAYHTTDGFGFAFPMGSPLVADVSRAILKVTGGEDITKIKNQYFKSTTCLDDSSTGSLNRASSQIGVHNFQILFILLTGIIAITLYLKAHYKTLFFVATIMALLFALGWKYL